MDPNFFTAVNQSTLLDAQSKSELLAIAPRFTVQQIQKIVSLIQESEAKKGEILSHFEGEKLKLKQAHLEKMEFFFKHTFPKLLRGFEDQDKMQEEDQLNALMAQLEHV